MIDPGKVAFEAMLAYGTRLVGERDELAAALHEAADLAAELAVGAYPQSEPIQRALKEQCAAWHALAQRVQDGSEPKTP